MKFAQKQLDYSRDAVELAYLENAFQWTDLLKRIKESSNCVHLTTLLAAVKDSKDVRQTRARRQSKDSKQKLKKRASLNLHPASEGNLLRNLDYQDDWYNYVVPKYERKLLQLEGVYRDLVSEDFNYHVGTLGPSMDLFFLNILLNRRDMADVFWKRCAQVLAIKDSIVMIIFL